MDPKDYSKTNFGSNYSMRKFDMRVNLTGKRKVIDETLDKLHTMQMDMIEYAVEVKEGENFPEANEVINYIRNL